MMSNNAKWLVGTGLTVLAMTGTAFAGWGNLTDRIAVAEEKAQQTEKNLEDIKENLEWLKRYLMEKDNEQPRD